MDQNDRRSSFGYRFPENFPWVYQGRVKDAPGDRNIALHAVLGIQDRDVELLDGQVLEPWREDPDNVARRPDRQCLVAMLGGHAPAELERSVDHDRPDLSYPGMGREVGNRPHCEAAE